MPTTNTLTNDQVFETAGQLFAILLVANYDETGRYSEQRDGALYGDVHNALRNLLVTFFRTDGWDRDDATSLANRVIDLAHNGQSFADAYAIAQSEV